MTADLGSLRGHASRCMLPLSGHKIFPLRALFSLHSHDRASFHYLCSLIPPHAWDSLTSPLSLTRRFPAQHTLTLFSCHFPTQANTPLFKVSNFCSRLLLVRSVVVWEPSGYILSHGEPLEARHREYKRLKLGGGQAYDRSNDYTAVVEWDNKDRAQSVVLSLEWQTLYILYIHMQCYTM
jgi:hypothetical protein